MVFVFLDDSRPELVALGVPRPRAVWGGTFGDGEGPSGRRGESDRRGGREGPAVGSLVRASWWRGRSAEGRRNGLGDQVPCPWALAPERSPLSLQSQLANGAFGVGPAWWCFASVGSSDEKSLREQELGLVGVPGLVPRWPEAPPVGWRGA